jgi:hypothetical protein
VHQAAHLLAKDWSPLTPLTDHIMIAMIAGDHHPIGPG